MTFADPLEFPDGKSIEATRVRWVSEGGLWRLQIDPVLFGLRLHLVPADFKAGGEARWLSNEVVYCMGTARATVLMLPRIVMKILEPVPEVMELHGRLVPTQPVRELFPRQRRKPMENDPQCWAALCDAAGIDSAVGRDFDLRSMGDVPFRPLLDYVLKAGAV